MRKILTLFAMMLSIASFAISNAANYGQASIHVSSQAYDEYELRVDGRSYRISNNDLRLNDVNTGTHQLEVYRIQRGTGGIFGSRDKSTLVYNNNISLSQDEQVEVMINSSGNVNVREYNNGSYGNNNGGYGNNNGGYGNNNGGIFGKGGTYGNGYGQASVRVISSAYDEYEVRIDGRSYRVNGSGLNLDNLNAGVHQLEVYRVQRGSGGIFGSRDKTYLVYNNNINLSQGEQAVVNINNNGNVTVRENNNGGYNKNGKYKKQKKNKNGKWDDDDEDDRDHDHGRGNDWKNGNRN